MHSSHNTCCCGSPFPTALRAQTRRCWKTLSTNLAISRNAGCYRYCCRCTPRFSLFRLMRNFQTFWNRKRGTQRYLKCSKCIVPTTLAVVGLLFSQPCEHRREDVGNRVLRTPISPETRVIVVVAPLASLYFALYSIFRISENAKGVHNDIWNGLKALFPQHLLLWVSFSVPLRTQTET